MAHSHKLALGTDFIVVFPMQCFNRKRRRLVIQQLRRNHRQYRRMDGTVGIDNAILHPLASTQEERRHLLRRTGRSMSAFVDDLLVAELVFRSRRPIEFPDILCRIDTLESASVRQPAIVSETEYPGKRFPRNAPSHHLVVMHVLLRIVVHEHQRHERPLTTTNPHLLKKRDLAHNLPYLVQYLQSKHPSKDEDRHNGRQHPSRFPKEYSYQKCRNHSEVKRSKEPVSKPVAAVVEPTPLLMRPPRGNILSKSFALLVTQPVRPPVGRCKLLEVLFRQQLLVIGIFDELLALLRRRGNDAKIAIAQDLEILIPATAKGRLVLVGGSSIRELKAHILERDYCGLELHPIFLLNRKSANTWEITRLAQQLISTCARWNRIDTIPETIGRIRIHVHEMRLFVHHQRDIVTGEELPLVRFRIVSAMHTLHQPSAKAVPIEQRRVISRAKLQGKIKRHLATFFVFPLLLRLFLFTALAFPLLFFYFLEYLALVKQLRVPKKWNPLDFGERQHQHTLNGRERMHLFRRLHTRDIQDADEPIMDKIALSNLPLNRLRTFPESINRPRLLVRPNVKPQHLILEFRITHPHGDLHSLRNNLRRRYGKYLQHQSSDDGLSRYVSIISSRIFFCIALRLSLSRSFRNASMTDRILPFNLLLRLNVRKTANVR